MRQEEHYNQVAVFQWADSQGKKYPGLCLLYAIPNGGHRHIAVARKLKAEGVKAGVPDVCLPIPRGTFHGLYIEMKAAKGRTTEAQDYWLKALSVAGNKVAVCHNAEEAISVLKAYLEGGI